MALFARTPVTMSPPLLFQREVRKLTATRRWRSSSFHLQEQYRHGATTQWWLASNGGGGNFYTSLVRRWRSSDNALGGAMSDDDRSYISIGDVRVKAAPRGSGRPDLVPVVSSSSSSSLLPFYIPPCQLSHLRWMLQKDLGLQQDFLFCGPPSLARDRRHLLFLYAALTGREVEYVALSRDTSDADLKQRKEVSSSNYGILDGGASSSSSSSSVYVNQAPVRAALYGRLLILDGLEKAERNVLPTLNNLLENRELSLDDGRLIVSPRVFQEHGGDGGGSSSGDSSGGSSSSSSSSSLLLSCHPDFRVAALASDTRTLDPPLRSRFQARIGSSIDPGEVLASLLAAEKQPSSSTRQIPVGVVQELVELAAADLGGVPLQSLHHALGYMERSPYNISPRAALNAYTTPMLGIEDIICDRSLPLSQSKSTPPRLPPAPTINKEQITTHDVFIETPTTLTIQELILSAVHDSHSRGIAIVGPKGCYKSALLRQLARRTQKNGTIELFSLHPDMTARDLLLTRGTDDVYGQTIWRKTPLTRAVERGSWVLLDGIDKLHSDTLTSALGLLLEQGVLDLPDGTRLRASDGFQCFGLAHPPDQEDNNNNHWLTPEVLGMFHFLRVDPLPSAELKTVLGSLYPSLNDNRCRGILDRLVRFRDRLEEAIQSGAADSPQEQESLVLSLRKLKHICKRLVMTRRESEEELLPHLIENALMTRLMPDRDRHIVYACMKDCGIEIQERQQQQAKRPALNGLDPNLLELCRRTPQNPLLVPNPVFEENPGHSQVLDDILNAHSVGETALLIMGYQGVGKNRVVDYLLSQLRCEREYLQLHRDTTIQSLLASPSVENGRIVYGDSPLVRAARNGRILVVDEADKAPVEVVALLKGLIEDGELALPDGRVLRYQSWKPTKSSTNDVPTVEEDEGSYDDTTAIGIHPDFRIWALANPATYPFHGNDISGEMSDVFSCHTVPPLDPDSQRKILQSYGPKVLDHVIEQILDIWKDLGAAHEKGVLAYPFSIREAVSVTKHLNEFPDDGLQGALENVIAFDRFDTVVLKQLGRILADHGLSITSFRNGTAATTSGIEGGISTPRTRASNPKHGKVDENNDPHVGGNTWAGGSGGSDTAGLGGRGGPYRLDSGHPVHQISDAMKAEVTAEAQKKARRMAEEGLAEKLKNLKMGKLDWERYNHLQSQVATQIHHLQVLLRDIKRRKHERVWLKRQSNGELDDSRLVDALAGEKDVFKKRGRPTETVAQAAQAVEPMAIKLVVDISASMYRFNGYDGRLQRLLEATLMIMEALKGDDRFTLTIVGHNGDSAEIPLVNPTTPQDPKTQLKVLETMVAHTQYTFPGDHTVAAMEAAISQAREGDLVLVISDANLKRYRIDPRVVSDLLNRKAVHAHLVLIGNFGEEASNLARMVPNQRAQVCLNSEDLPLIMKRIVASAVK